MLSLYIEPHQMVVIYRDYQLQKRLKYSQWLESLSKASSLAKESHYTFLYIDLNTVNDGYN